MYDQAELKVHVMPCGFGGAEAGGWFAKEIKTSDDLKGLRMRIFGLGGRVMSRLGATTVLVPGGEIVAAFDKRQIDAAELYPPAVDAQSGLKDKVKLIYVPGWHQPETVLELIVNKDRWDALTDRERGLIDGACLATLQATLDSSAKLQADALADFAKSGVRIENFPPDVLASLHQAWTDVAKDEGDQDYFFRTVFDDIEKFTRQVANVPRRRPRRTSRPSRVPGRDESHAVSAICRYCVFRKAMMSARSGVGNARERERHRGIRDHGLGVGDPLVDILFRPDKAFFAELLHAG